MSNYTVELNKSIFLSDSEYYHLLFLINFNAGMGDPSTKIFSSNYNLKV